MPGRTARPGGQSELSREDDPTIRHYPPSPIDIYRVSGDELRRIEEGYGHTGLALTVAGIFASTAAGFITALLTTHPTGAARDILIAAAAISAIVFLISAYASWRDRRKGHNVISEIRSRPQEPLLPVEKPDEPATASTS